MVPKLIQVLDRMPINNNGKVDRQALAKRVDILALHNGLHMLLGPRNHMENVLWEEFRDILGMNISIDQSFFECGGHSLMATKLASRINKRLDARITVKDIFEFPTIIGLAERVKASLGTKYVPIPRIHHNGAIEQSFAQGRLWFLNQLQPSSTWYLMPFANRLHGPLQLPALEAALLALAERHETLRTTFHDQDGVGFQVVHAFQPTPLKVIDISSNKEDDLWHALCEEQAIPFDLTIEPGWRPSVFRLGPEDHVLSIVMHHIISDGWSMDILRKELMVFYAAAIRGQPPLEQVDPLPINYRDFSVWQRQEEQTREHQRQLEYWVKQLDGSQPAEFLSDKSRPIALSGAAGLQKVKIDGPLYDELQRFCKAYQVTPFIVLLAAFRATHYRLTGAQDATIGTPIANRSRQELEGLIGFFVNLQCIRILIEDESFHQLVQQVQSTATTAFAHQDVPFERIVSELQKGRDLSRNPLVQVTFAVHSQLNLGQFSLEGVEAEQISLSPTSRFDLEFHLYQQEHSLSGNVLFALDLFYPETINTMLLVFYDILRHGLTQPHTILHSIPLTDGYAALDKMGLIQIERTDYPRESSIVEVFQEQVLAHPDRIAVKDSSMQLTYRELDHRSDQLACWLAWQIYPPETLVGVLAHRSCETIVAFLGILKANLAYLPLDVKSPTGRTDVILSSANSCTLILVGPDVQPPSIQAERIHFVLIMDALKSEAGLAPRSQQASANSLAYVMFTSGSTGKPKGVMIEHRGVVRLAKKSGMLSHPQQRHSIAHMSNIAFDVSTWEIYTTILNGGTLICIDAMAVLDHIQLHNIFRQEEVRVAMFTPALLKKCVDDFPQVITSLETLFIAGDRLDPRDLFKAQGLIYQSIVNAYGPTENTGASTIYYIPQEEVCVNGVPIGRSISNSGAYVMDPNFRLVPVGVMGELVVTGDGLARGYTDPQLNDGRFVTINIGGESVRAYRTGDLVRYRPSDGQLECFGRMDQQIKIRGHRIELAEIEHTLLNDPIVSDAVTVVQRHRDDDPELVSFVTLDQARGLAQPLGRDNEETEQVEGWKDLFDTDRYDDIANVQRDKIGRDFVGWTSMYDGKEIDTGEMNEWLDDTINALLNSGRPGNVLEVGTGTGMILFNVLVGLQHYIGLEPARKAAQFVTRAVQSIPGLEDKVRIQIGTAADLTNIDNASLPDLAIINSVAQYFPSPKYLLKVVEDLVGLQGAKCIFFGDIRSYALYQEFQVSKALHRLGETATVNEIRQDIAKTARTEEELLVDPGIFTALPSQFPDLIEHVEILPKRMVATNELSCYRYAAVLHTKRRDGDHLHVHKVEDDQWVDFMAQRMDRQSLLKLLQGPANDSVVAISNIPNSKAILERHIVDLLDNQIVNVPGHDGWFQRVRNQADCCPSLSTVDLLELAQQTGFRVEISWSRQHSQRGGLDAIFHHLQPQNERGRVLFQFPTDHEGRPIHRLSNHPLQPRFNEKTEKRLLEALQLALPSYMVPKLIRVLDKMPINNNGKVDRQALANRTDDPAPFTDAAVKLGPRNDLERVVCEEFAILLGFDVGVTDDFFDLGGHSLKATQVVSRINQLLRCSISVFDLFQHPTPAAIVEHIKSRSIEEPSNRAPWYIKSYHREQSRATIVLVHPIYGQANFFSPLVPLLDETFDILLIQDPFFGSSDGPETLADWATFYLNDVKKRLPQNHPIIFGGFSFGGLIAFEMASLWRNWYSDHPASVILLDPGTFTPEDPFLEGGIAMQKEISRALQIFGADQRPAIEGHLDKISRLWSKSTKPPKYYGSCLYLVTSQSARAGVIEWWTCQCPKLKMDCLDCEHWAMLDANMVGPVSQLINEHCHCFIEELYVRGDSSNLDLAV